MWGEGVGKERMERVWGFLCLATASIHELILTHLFSQILEIETFIPMLLQRQDEGGSSRLKRVVLIGDHHQLPPVVKNMAFQKYRYGQVYVGMDRYGQV